MLVKDFHLETPYLTALVHNPADVLIADFYPHNEFAAIVPCPILRPSGEPESVFIGGAIAPRFVSVSFEVLILKVEL